MAAPIKQYLEVGQEVIFVGPDKKHHKAKITIVYNDNSVRLEWLNGVAIATHSYEEKENTFHFGDASTKLEYEE